MPDAPAQEQGKQNGERHRQGQFLIPAGVLIGLGVGLIFGQAAAGLLIGLGLGFLGSAFMPVPSTAGTAGARSGPRWALAIIGIFLVLVGVSVITGLYLPWTFIIAAVLILIGLWFVARGFGWMK